MDPIVLVVAFVLVLVLVLLMRSMIRGKGERMDVRHREMQALSKIVAGNKIDALNALREIARKDTGNISIYMQVGDLYRQTGDPEAAVRVHIDLLDRDGIGVETQRMVHERLALDYEELARWDHAMRHAEALLRFDKRNTWALKAIHRYQTKLKNWDEAIKAYQREVAVTKSPNDMLPALYRTTQARESLAGGDMTTAINQFKQAIKLGNRFPAPYYHLGKLMQEENNFKHAIDYLTTFAELDPTAGSLVYSDIEKMYFELGQFDQVEQFYKRLAKKLPDNSEVLLGLANYYERKGEHREALALLEETRAESEDTLSFILGRLHLMEKLDKLDELNRAIDDYISSDRNRRILACNNCGNQEEEPSYICPECGQLAIDHLSP